MSQSGITDPARSAGWDEWYFEHLRIMASVPGVSSAQRFKTDHTGHSPSLAMYTFASAGVFEDPYYLSVRGMGEWAALVDRRFYRRNLFDGLDVAPQVSQSDVLLVADREKPDDPVPGVRFTWLQSVAIDRSTPYRGVAVLSGAALPGLPDTVALYRPASQRYAHAPL